MHTVNNILITVLTMPLLIANVRGTTLVPNVEGKFEAERLPISVCT